MEILKELISLFSLKYVEHTRHMASVAFKKSDSHTLFQSIKNEHYETEEDIVRSMFGEGNAGKDKYRKLYKRTLSILTGNLFLKPTEKKTDYKSVFQECYKKALVVKLLKSEGKQKSAMYIAENTLKKAMKYHITEVCRDLSKELMLAYQIRGDRQMRLKHKSLYEHYTKIDAAETQAYILLNEVAYLASKYKKPKKDELESIINLIDDIQKIDEDSYILNIRKIRARIIKANFQNDHESAFIVLKEALDYFKRFSFPPPDGYLYNILNKVSPSLIITGRYEEAKRNIEKCLSLRQVGEHNWHITLQHQAILGFYSKDYQLAGTSIQLAKKHSKGLSSYMLEWWKIAEAYWYFAGSIGLTEYEGKFRPAKFLNEVPNWSKDKNGANVSIKLIAEFLIELARGNRDVFIDKPEALRIYSYDHLKGDTNQRCRAFIWIVRQLGKSSFDPDTFKARTSAKLTQLTTAPAKIEDLETEIIPYEHLYDMVVLALERELVPV